MILLNYVPPRNPDPPKINKNTPSNTTNAASPVPTSIAGSVTSDLTGVSFAQTGATVTGTDGAIHAHITCFACNSKGHYASVCPATTGTTALHTTVESTVDDDEDSGTNGVEDDTLYG